MSGRLRGDACAPGDSRFSSRQGTKLGSRRFIPLESRTGVGVTRVTAHGSRGLWLAALLGVLAPWQARAQSVQDLQHMSIDELSNIDVSSVTKTVQPLSDAPAAIYVITHEDIIRSGAQSVPEMLRLAPNLEVMQTSASGYVITARGFSGNNQAQAFSDKLLVLIDGRSVYSPLFSGVYWDMQDVLPEDIERIEVISGPGATLWGANAVNGVINIITRKSGQTQGGVLDVGAGNLGRSASLQYGGRISADLTYRLYAKGFIDNDTETATGAKAGDGWYKPQGGFRFDWTPGAETVTLQGDAYQGAEAQAGAEDESISGRNLLARWTHGFAGGSSLQVQAYYDRTSRSTAGGGGSFNLDTYDVDLQHSFALGDRNQVVWGGGFRIAEYEITNNGSLLFVPSSRTLNLSNAFVQDSLSLTPALKLILGLKLEDDPYSGVTPLPSARVSWKISNGALVWAAVSRAIRSPTPFDVDVQEDLGGILFLKGNEDFQPEKLTAYELGARVQPAARLSLSISAYYNVYDDLRSIEVAPGGFLPLQWGNMMQGRTYGVEAWADYRVADWWRLTAGLEVQHESLDFKPGASGLLGLSQAGDDPHHQASLRSSMNLGKAVTFDADLRYIGMLPDPHVPSYVELNSRLGWNVSERVQLSLSGFNLLHARHQEFPDPATYVQRSFFAEARFRF